MPTKVKISHCPMVIDIGELMGRKSYCWSIEHNKDNHKVVDGLVYNFEHHVYPWIDRAKTLTDMHQHFIQYQMWFLAARAAVFLGLSLDNIMESANRNDQQLIQHWLAKHAEKA